MTQPKQQQHAPPVIVPPASTHSHTVIFLHGRGDNARNFSLSLRYSTTSRDLNLGEAFPSFRWVFPQAAMENSVGFGGNMTSQWFDIYNVRDFAQHEDLQAVGLRVSVERIRELILQEADMLGGRYDRVILMGISQGAATSVHTLLNLDLPCGLGAFLGFSCRMPFPGRTLSETRKVLTLDHVPAHATVLEKTPMMLEHCANDPLVLVENGRALRDTLRGFGATVAWKEYPDGGHWFNSPRGIEDAIEFLNKIIGGPSTPASTTSPVRQYMFRSPP